MSEETDTMDWITDLPTTTAADGDLEEELVTEQVTEPVEKEEPATPVVDSEPVFDVAAYEKRLKDNQAAYHQEHQQRLELEKRIAELEERTKKVDVEPPDDSEDLEAFEADPFGWILKRDKRLKSEIEASKAELAAQRERIKEEIQEQQWSTQFERDEKKLRSEHDDYDKVVEDYLAPLCQKDPGVLAEWDRRGRTAEAAYALGKEMQMNEALVKDPAAVREQMKLELLAELRAEGVGGQLKEPPATLDNINSHGVIEDRKAPRRDILDGVFG